MLDAPGLLQTRLDLDLSTPRRGEANVIVNSPVLPKLPHLNPSSSPNTNTNPSPSPSPNPNPNPSQSPSPSPSPNPNQVAAAATPLLITVG